ncbi:MAG TPA: ATP-grasp domain-containing protein [Bryobacteraceae bacterium]|nr:ATP-grasp domain-containing protein [Bryobacteraceae bacterium]
MPRVLLVAATTGYQTRAFADAARQLGLDLALATDRCHVLEDPWGDHAIPVRFDDPLASRDVLLAAGPFDAVVAVADRPTLVAALAAEALCIPYNSPASVAVCHDKYLARQRFQAAGLPVPKFFRVPINASPIDTAHRAPFPCVLKPLGLSASRGVIRANNVAEFEEAFVRIRALLGSADVAMMREEQNRYIQVESFLDGREFALEGLVTAGELQALAIFDKPDPLDGPFFEETIYVTPSRESPATQQALAGSAGRAVRALGLTHGPIHAELRLQGGNVWVLEVAARPIGGLCARTLQFDGGVSLEELILRHALGEDVSHVRLSHSASGVMMIPIPNGGGIYRGVEGLQQASAIADVEDVIITAKEGQKILPLPEGASYLGFIFARAGSPARVEHALREAHACLRFDIATVLPVMRR